MNRLLAAMSLRLVDLLQPEEGVLARGAVVLAPGTPITHAWFPHTAVICAVVELSDGRRVESGTIGCEGVVGGFAVHGHSHCSLPHSVKIGGRAARVPIDRLRHVHASSGEVRTMLAAFEQALFVQMSQAIACNAVHDVPSRLARLLLTCHDRNPSDLVPITHGLLAELLGVSRPRITLAASGLQVLGAVKSGYGAVQIADRDRLEQRACECYRRVRDAYDRALPPRLTRDDAAPAEKLCAVERMPASA